MAENNTTHGEAEQFRPALWWWTSFRRLIIDTRHDEKSCRRLLEIVDREIAKLNEEKETITTTPPFDNGISE